LRGKERGGIRIRSGIKGGEGGGRDVRVRGCGRGGFGRGDGGVVEEVLGGEAGGDGVFAVGEFGEALEAELDVVLGLDLEVLLEQRGFELGVVLVSGGGEELFGLVLGEAGGGEEVVQLGGLCVGEGVLEVRRGGGLWW